MKNISGNTMAIVYDDHRMFAESIGSLIERTNCFQSVHTFSEEKELMNFLMKKGNQNEMFFFVDFYLDNKHCIPIINEAKRVNKKVQIIIVSSVQNAGTIKYIDTFEPHGFLSKKAGFDEVLACIHTLQEGKRYISPFMKQILNDDNNYGPVKFTPRETELLQYFYQGHSIVSTAEQMSLSMHTVVGHRRRMMEKAKCKSMAELLVFCRKNGLVSDPEPNRTEK
ncbi:response regulator transcription factor [Dyadobacter sp. CY312]|uniref:response regulator transcription factor n=1 Tax=Dyadobacter sp. CY312 TaxID=2907303 RepID=UPI001F45C967|nr:response regulator transcription factor [Dyadobacter sp. CY312]MCE7044423.1 response regulator transcription factor [Dyadobacter sp. CY312]